MLRPLPASSKSPGPSKSLPLFPCLLHRSRRKLPPCASSSMTISMRSQHMMIGRAVRQAMKPVERPFHIARTFQKHCRAGVSYSPCRDPEPQGRTVVEHVGHCRTPTSPQGRHVSLRRDFLDIAWRCLCRPILPILRQITLVL